MKSMRRSTASDDPARTSGIVQTRANRSTAFRPDPSLICAEVIDRHRTGVFGSVDRLVPNADRYRRDRFTDYDRAANLSRLVAIASLWANAPCDPVTMRSWT